MKIIQERKLARGEAKVREGARGGKPLGDSWKFIVRR